MTAAAFPRILMFGRDGQLARALLQRAPEGRVAALARADVDLADEAAVAAAVRGAECDLVVNAAAWTGVDAAEEAEAEAAAINARAPAVMAEACAERDLPFVTFSTDYVFSGAPGRPWRETDATAPLNAYGRSKAEGEAATLAAWPRSLVVRTSWVYSPWGRNFVTTMLRLKDRPSLRVVNDQLGRPTDARELARFIVEAAPRLAQAQPDAFGLLHVAGGGEPVTWAGFAEAVFAAAGGAAPIIEGVTTADYGAPAVRPLNGVLDCRLAAERWGFQAQDWRDSLRSVVARLVDGGPGA